MRSPKSVLTRRRLALALIAGVVAGGCSSPGAQPPAPNVQVVDGPVARQLKASVSDAGAVTHLQALQKIADDNGGNRASPGPGYDASVDYVTGVLRAAGYDVATPAFELPRKRGREQGTARNVITQTRTGDPAHVVVIGAHLDSVEDGPGIVDNGSGVATLLEIARHLGPSAPLRNTVRFAFFGSEESGSEGSTSYVNGLSTADREKIALYLNVDMVASPNGGYFAQGGVGDEQSQTGPPGSAAVAGVLAGQLAATGVKAEAIKFVGDDETPFVDAGIPSGGAENGDRKDKSGEQAQAWGGQADERYDPCYHKACDRLENVNRVVLGHYLTAIAGTVAYFATSDQSILR
ncbi:M20/M25/M40 family metallo-hydrolase [Amycolatopsis sp. FDAARGOS 1241]|uniref:M20/M25/M40 family metallo-hydrolase n=1 Tax=Amycolatopsis sp. FDAARGOS 1241 TaxID=2778070 RepID=UPI00194FEA59|nr:M20/M25/M40 family metallo-hydrolase [Amycolatopsis sp. FDAARGOS 1241]QRP44764.1 M20/M25/M40 family metallo-hydrolase [Amycolatopsis sp. FDAARGOS 1241]